MQRVGSRRQRSLAQELQAGSLRQELQPQEQLGLLQVLQVQLPELQVQVQEREQELAQVRELERDQALALAWDQDLLDQQPCAREKG